MKIAPPRPDVAPTPTIEPRKHTIESPWAGAGPTPAPGDRPNAASTSTKNSATEKQWLINVGLFAVEDNARNAYMKLDAAGLPATLQPLNTSKGQRFRLRVGPYTSRADADAAAGKIRALALDAVVLENKPLQTQ